MAQCTAPKNGHRTASGRANCPVCGRGYGTSPIYHYQRTPFPNSSSSSNSLIHNNDKQRTIKAKWSSSNSKILYTPSEIRTLTPVRKNVEARSELPNAYDVFLCHAWDDRKLAAKQFYDLLVSRGVTVWFSEKNLSLGTSLLREIDKGLSKSRIGIVLVTPHFIKRIQKEGAIADKELSALLARDLLVPIVHETSFEELRNISPLLASRSGLDTKEESMEEIAEKIAELVTL